MRLLPLLTTFNGRISRKSWWLGFIIWLAGSLAGTLLIIPDFFTAEEPPPPNWAETLWQLALCVPITAITVKRFNDRQWPWWVGYASAVISIVVLMAPHFGIEIEPDAGGMATAAFWGVGIFGLIVLIDNGFLRGTDGPNRYGPDPLAPAALPA